MTPVAVS